jgi:hypothetical protein
MASTLNPTRSEFSEDRWSTTPPVDAIIKRPSLGRRAIRGLARFLIIFCIGVGATLAWQSYGDVARAMIADSFPQLGWLAPSAAAPQAAAPQIAAPEMAAHQAQLASETVALGTSSDAPPQLQQLRDMSLLFAAMRQSVDQLAANQQQMAGDIAKLLADQQQLMQKASAPAPRPAAAPAHKPAPPPSSAAR